ncbi:MAG: extracellular solute-binding protein, partial [Limnochordia bacterium]
MSLKNRRLCLSAVLLMLFLFACGSLAANTEITFLTSGYSAAMIQYLREDVASMFLRSHGADVTVMTVNWDQRQERIMVLTAGGTPPDVVVTGFYSPYEEGSMGLLEPLDRYMQGWKYTTRFSKPLWEAMSWRGQVMAVPQSLDFRGIGYNKRLFAEAGFDSNRPPDGWDEMVQYARRLTKIEGQTVAVRGFWCTDTAAGAAQQLFWYMRQAGLTEVNLDTFTSNLKDPRATQALQVLQELHEAGQGRLPVLGGGFGQGRIAMRYLAPSNVASWVAADPEFMDNVGLFAPRQTPHSEPVSHVFANGLAIPGASKNKDLAWEFISLLTSDEVIFELQRIGWHFAGRLDMLQRMTTVQPGIELWY